MSSVYDLKKKIVVYTEDNKSWTWKEYSLKSIAKSQVYRDTRVGDKTLVDFLNEHKTCLKPEDKQLLWSALDTASNNRIRNFWNNPEIKIASAEKIIKEDDAIVAFFEYQSNYYHGEEQVVASSAEEIFNTNGTVKFSNYMETSPNFKWLPTLIALGKHFDIVPNWQHCIHAGKRGLGLTAHDAKEFQTVVNWYIGNAELGNDYSDKIELHNINPAVDTVTITQHQYLQDKTTWDDWKELDTYDFLAPLHSDESEDDE